MSGDKIEFSDTKVLYYKKVIKLTDKEKAKSFKIFKNRIKKKFLLVKFFIVKFFKINFFFKLYSRITRVMK